MAGIYHNSAYIIDTDDGSEAGLYRKMHIQMIPFYEKFYFTG
jgi:N-carbamoylputrescine amidase